MQTTITDLDSELPKTRNNILLHLAGHAGLTRTGMSWRVRIRIGGKGAIFLWRFIKTYSAANVGVALRELVTTSGAAPPSTAVRKASCAARRSFETMCQ